MIEKLSSSTSISYSSDITKKVNLQENKAKEVNKEEKELNKEQLEEVIKSLNEFVQPTHTSIQFELHEESQKYYVKVVDLNTNETIREIPSKKMLDIYAAMTQFLGLMFDQKI
ncbi:flagellar protein FlaG [Bacillus songklensis]|uniref:Flagellar protein FlaG n=1 Tax=Bacillus songklensis TaxID=1069116 RepID=A0ABV8BBM8_9BACI